VPNLRAYQAGAARAAIAWTAYRTGWTWAQGEALDRGFHITALRMIWLKVLEPNTPGIRVYTAAGFKPAARLRQSGYWLGQPCDELIMDALPEDHPGPSQLSA
jgi:RimJ/RimL family protein N-acetyltransferase